MTEVDALLEKIIYHVKDIATLTEDTRISAHTAGLLDSDFFEIENAIAEYQNK